MLFLELKLIVICFKKSALASLKKSTLKFGPVVKNLISYKKREFLKHAFCERTQVEGRFKMVFVRSVVCVLVLWGRKNFTYYILYSKTNNTNRFDYSNEANAQTRVRPREQKGEAQGTT